jgi:hypothetical protein
LFLICFIFSGTTGEIGEIISNSGREDRDLIEIDCVLIFMRSPGGCGHPATLRIRDPPIPARPL